MPAFRILGGLAALSFFVVQILRYRRRHVSRLNLIITCALCIVIVALAISPSFFNPVFRTFNFQPPANQPDAEARTRLIFVLVVAVVILFALYLRLQSSADTNERAIRLLVEALGQERFDWDRAASLPDGPRLVTVSPAYNEAENVAAVIKAMPQMVEGYHVVPVVVSDGSEDQTAAVAREAGYEVALKMSADIVVTLDADGQHLPEELGVMIAPIVAGEADYVNGSRLLGYFEKESTIRHLGVHFFSWLVTILTGTRVTDISSGYRAARADLLRPLVLEQDQFWTSEILIEALRHHARIVEVPITILARAGGKSKKPKSLKYGWNFSKVIIQTWLR
jgi:hypothetical protein